MGHKSFYIKDRKVGANQPCYIIAEISCNHEGDKEEAKKIIHAAAEAGADAVKIQTYTADTITRDFSNKPEGTMWADIDLYALYKKAHTPWDWSFELKEVSESLGLHFFSSPFDETAVDFLVKDLGVPVLKIASFEIVDTKLLEKAAKSGLPIILSNGMSDFLELKEAIDCLRQHGCKDLAVLHCNSGYPAAFHEANLKTIPAMAELFDTVIGVSDHTLYYDHENHETPMAHITPLEAVKLGAKVVEVHLMTDRAYARTLFEKQEGGFDWPFSREPEELARSIKMIREYEANGHIEYDTQQEADIAQIPHGKVNFAPTEKELKSRVARPSLWVVKNVKAGEVLSFAAENKEHGNFDSIRPAGGLHVRFTDLIHGKKAAKDLRAGQPLSWEDIES